MKKMAFLAIIALCIIGCDNTGSETYIDPEVTLRVIVQTDIIYDELNLKQPFSFNLSDGNAFVSEYFEIINDVEYELTVKENIVAKLYIADIFTPYIAGTTYHTLIIKDNIATASFEGFALDYLEIGKNPPR